MVWFTFRAQMLARRRGPETTCGRLVGHTSPRWAERTRHGALSKGRRGWWDDQVAGCAATLMTSISAVSLLPFVSGPSITEITGIPASDPGAHSWALGHIRRCTTRYRFANRHACPKRVQAV